MAGDRELKRIEEILEKHGKGYEEIEKEEIREKSDKRIKQQIFIGGLAVSIAIGLWEGLYIHTGAAGILAVIGSWLWSMKVRDEEEL